MTQYLTRLPFGIQWIFASSLGFALGNQIGFDLDAIMYRIFGISLIKTWIGIVLGILQYFVLNRKLPRAEWWVLATGAGWFAVDALTEFIGKLGEVLAVCVLPSIAQLVGLSRTGFKSICWVPVSILGMVFGGWIGGYSEQTVGIFVGGAVEGAIYGLITCAVINKLLRPDS